MNDLVSIYVPTRNRLNMLRRAVESVLNQSYPRIELMICDDASDDGTEGYGVELAKRDSRVRFLRNEVPRGACAARNLGIQAAEGRFITGLDDDDEFSINRIARFLEIWDDRFSFICSDFLNRRNSKDRPEYNSAAKVFPWEILLTRNLASNQVFTYTERLQSINGFDVRAKRLQDWDTWLRLGASYGEFLRDSAPTYVMHHDHVNSSARVSRNVKISEAMVDLVDRNSSLYDERSRDFMESNIKFLRRTLSLGDAMHTMKSSGMIKPIAWFIMQKLVSRDH